jgi:hypothetical protein
MSRRRGTASSARTALVDSGARRRDRAVFP